MRGVDGALDGFEQGQLTVPTTVSTCSCATWSAGSGSRSPGRPGTLRHAEVLEDGELATRQLRYAWSVDRYTLAGAGAQVWE